MDHMRRKKAILLCLFTTISIAFLCFKTTVKAEPITNPITDADITDITNEKDFDEVTISYVLEDKKELILKSSEKDVIDLNALKSELGEANIKINSEKNEIKINLDKPDKIDFKILVNNKTPFKLSALDSAGKLIFEKDFNAIEKYNDDEDDEYNNADEATWKISDKLLVSEGPILEHSDGTTTRPYLYFGDYNFAKNRISIAESYASKGKSRINSLTAPNSAILYAEKGSRIQDGPDAPNNHIYTSHYGDNQTFDHVFDNLNIEDRAYGSANSFTSNNLFNYVVQTDEWTMPGTSGPDKLGKSYSMPEKPKFYHRTNPQTGLEEQRMVFTQRAFATTKEKRLNPVITTTIKMSFNNAGRVITNITFKNTGEDVFNNFSGISNHDLSLNKDGKEITDNGKKIGNYVPMRSLGNERGMYIQSKNNEIRTSFYMNHADGPNAWAARSFGRSYLATKGYMYNPGVAGLILASSERYYPWKSGKPKGRGSFYNKATNSYKAPHVPKSTYNAFESQRDHGDKETNLNSGVRLGVKEGDPLWDAGVTMRTPPKALAKGESVKLEYSTQTDINGKMFNPVLELDHQGTNDTPELLPLDAKKLEVSGSWYDFDSPSVTLYYSIDSEESEDYHPLLVGNQKPEQSANGTIFNFKKNIDISNLDKDKHRLRFILVDSDENYSHIKERVIKFIKPATVEPQINITSPGSTAKEPNTPFDDMISITGIWSDKDSKTIKSITYKIDEEPDKFISENIDNKTPGKLKRWSINDLDIKKFNDFKLHKIKLKITDVDGNEGTDTFYFKHIPGSMQLTAPEHIDFGSLSVSPNSLAPVKPKTVDGKVLLDDYREEKSNPVGISLSIDKFYKEDPLPPGDGDDGDDGDDSGSAGDPDKYLDGDKPKETLVHDVYWNNKLADSNNLIVGKTPGPKNDQWQQSTDFTDEVLKNLKLNFRAHEEGQSIGNYVSHWTWQTVDSL